MLVLFEVTIVIVHHYRNQLHVPIPSNLFPLHVSRVQTVENVMCVLRNLSYQLENEVDLQDGTEDVLDQDWETEQRRELEEASGR